MILVALALVALCAVVILGVLFGAPSGLVTLNFFDVASVDVTSIENFLIGLATGAVSVLSLWLLLASLRRAQQKASERRAMEKRHEELEKEKAELEHKLGRDRPEPTEAPDRDDTYGLTTQPSQDPDPR
jgi:hypothetical protein